MVPFWVPIIVQHLLFRVPKKGILILTTPIYIYITDIYIHIFFQLKSKKEHLETLGGKALLKELGDFLLPLAPRLTSCAVLRFSLPGFLDLPAAQSVLKPRSTSSMRIFDTSGSLVSRLSLRCWDLRASLKVTPGPNPRV